MKDSRCTVSANPTATNETATRGGGSTVRDILSDCDAHARKKSCVICTTHYTMDVYSPRMNTLEKRQRTFSVAEPNERIKRIPKCTCVPSGMCHSHSLSGCPHEHYFDDQGRWTCRRWHMSALLHEDIGMVPANNGSISYNMYTVNWKIERVYRLPFRCACGRENTRVTHVFWYDK